MCVVGILFFHFLIFTLVFPPVYYSLLLMEINILTRALRLLRKKKAVNENENENRIMWV